MSTKYVERVTPKGLTVSHLAELPDLTEIKKNMELLSQYEKPENSTIMEEFQKYILQASVEPYSIRRRNEFLKKAFQYYLDQKTKGKIIGSK